MPQIKIYDTTLRDGTQGEKVSLSVEDKLKIAKRLDEFGVDYIEGGWPGSNPKDLEFFQRVKDLELKRATIVAFGSTRRANSRPEEDATLQSLVAAETKAVAIFGKSWDFQVTWALNTTLEENLLMIEESVAYLKSKGKEVIYDAEHFFDAYKDNKDYALATLKAAERGGADVLALCDTNGGTLPWEIGKIIQEIKPELKTALGIHTHNDGDMAVANSLSAVAAGVIQVQGTMNGYGERCGNANLCSIIPALQLKMGLNCLEAGSLKKLTEISRYISELANLVHNDQQPYVGHSAFAHKAGIHVSAIMKNPKTYEHFDPELVGNQRRVLVSELSGKSNILYKAQQSGIDLNKDNPEAQNVLNAIKELENQGYQFEGAEGSLELLMKKEANLYRKPFQLKGLRIIVEKNGGGELVTEVIIKVEVDGQMVHTAAEGNGPVNALDKALRKALEGFYPQLKSMHLIDYKVRVLEEGAGTSAQVRVLIESTDGKDNWGTVGVSSNIIEASWRALVDSIEYGLLQDR